MSHDNQSGADASIVEVDGQLFLKVTCQASNHDLQCLIADKLNRFIDTARVADAGVVEALGINTATQDSESLPIAGVKQDKDIGIT